MARHPEGDSASERRVIGVCLACGSALVLLTGVVWAGTIRSLDLAIALGVIRDAPCGYVNFGMVLNPLVSVELSFIVLSVLAIVLGLRIGAPNRYSARYGWLVVGLLASLGVELAGKVWVDSPVIGRVIQQTSVRPDCALAGPNPLLSINTSNGYPSGSAIRLAYAATLAWLVIFSRRPNSGLSAFVLAVSTVALAATRVAIVWHWPSDVLGGLLIGLLAGIGVMWRIDRHRIGKPDIVEALQSFRRGPI